MQERFGAIAQNFVAFQPLKAAHRLTPRSAAGYNGNGMLAFQLLRTDMLVLSKPRPVLKNHKSNILDIFLLYGCRVEAASNANRNT